MMPKQRRAHTLYHYQSSSSQLPSNSIRQERSRNLSAANSYIKEWEEARCPICMEHPHSAVLLQCSSHDKGCRTYVCNTSNHHSNCLDQLRNFFAASSSHGESSEVAASRKAPLNEKLVCPLCRGQVRSWVVKEPARRFMNSKPRSCPCEACDFTGNYLQLRNHVRHAHPSVCPSDIDPTRKSEWLKLEREIELKDVLCVVLSEMHDGMQERISPAHLERLLAMHFSNGVLRGRQSSATTLPP